MAAGLRLAATVVVVVVVVLAPRCRMAIADKTAIMCIHAPSHMATRLAPPIGTRPADGERAGGRCSEGLLFLCGRIAWPGPSFPTRPCRRLLLTCRARIQRRRARRNAAMLAAPAVYI